MKLQLQIKMNEALFLRNPEQSELGKKIITHSIQLIYKNGFEAFTFKKLAEEKKIVKIPGKGCYWESFDNHLKENLKKSKQDCFELFESD